MSRVSRSNQVGRLFENVDPPGCWTWRGSTTHGGYGQLHDGSNRKAHRVVWEALNGPIPDGLIVMHKCDNPPCVRPDHLELGTQSQNQRDKWERGMGGRRQKLTRAQANEIRALYATGTVMQRELAERYGVVQTQISKIIRNDAWKE